MITPPQIVTLLLWPLFLVVLTTWIGASLHFLVITVRNGRRADALHEARTALAALTSAYTTDPSPADLQALLAARSVDVVLALTTHGAAQSSPALANAAVARIGRSRLERLVVASAAPSQNWRRIAAMQLLAVASTPGPLVALLRRTLDDSDQEIVGASLAALGRIPQFDAAAALIDGLKSSKYAASRVATYIDQIPLPMADLLRPLLHHPDVTVRYWGATLISRHPAPGIEGDLIALTRDAAPLVRKAAISSMARIAPGAAVPAARALIADEVWYVRAHAVRSLADAAGPDAAEEITPLLADPEWWVRLAARESLQAMGEEIWSTLVPYLDHEDAFARNGAAEVLQNIGVLDSLIVLEAATSRPSPVKLEMLRKIAAAGGTRMTEALLERVDADSQVRVRRLLTTLGLEPTEVRL